MKTKPVAKFFEKRFRKKSFRRIYQEERYLISIGVAIAEAREKSHLSQNELGKRLGTTQSVVSRIENGNQNLTLNMLAKIAYILHCELSLQMRPWRLAA